MNQSKYYSLEDLNQRSFFRLSRTISRCQTRFSKHQFTQLQLLAILYMMSYEDWTFREAEVRLGEPRALCQTLGLRRVADSTTLYRFLQRLDSQTLDRAVGETVHRIGCAVGDAVASGGRFRASSRLGRLTAPFRCKYLKPCCSD